MSIKKHKRTKSISPDTYRVDFAPDGIHWIKEKRGKVEKMWNDFTQNNEYRKFLIMCPPAKFRLLNETTGQVIGILGVRGGEIVHTGGKEQISK